MTPLDKKQAAPVPWIARLWWTLLFVAGALSLVALLCAALFCAAAGLPVLAYALAGLVTFIGVLLISAGDLS